jgi:hypothetical protein
MRFLLRLITTMLPLQVMVMDQTEDIPTGFDRVITKRLSYVVTSRSAFVIAKKYV